MSAKCKTDHIGMVSATLSATCALIALFVSFRSCSDAKSAIRQSQVSNELASNANVIARQALDLTKAVSVISTRPWVAIKPVKFPPNNRYCEARRKGDVIVIKYCFELTNTGQSPAVNLRYPDSMVTS